MVSFLFFPFVVRARVNCVTFLAKTLRATFRIEIPLDIVFSKFVPILAVSLLRVLRSDTHASVDIYLARNRFEVRWITTET